MPRKVLLLIFVHGFKGDNDTFAEFPGYLRDLLRPSIPDDVKIRPLIYPQYETSGELSTCVSAFERWFLGKLTDAEMSTGCGMGSAAAVLIGHSMGGILLADTIIQLGATSQGRVLGLMAFDTPYLGLNPKMVSNTVEGKWQQVSKAVSMIQGWTGGGNGNATSTTVTRTTTTTTQINTGGGWLKWAAGAGGLAAVAAAATVAYTQRSAISGGVGWAGAHLKFVGVLFQTENLTRRMLRLRRFQPNFANFYTVVNADPQQRKEGESTFCRLPVDRIGDKEGWHPAFNRITDSEINAHVGLFLPRSNSDYWGMAVRARNLSKSWVIPWTGERYDASEGAKKKEEEGVEESAKRAESRAERRARKENAEGRDTRPKPWDDPKMKAPPAPPAPHVAEPAGVGRR
ncbi:hypothetical protein BJ508DRAFT_418743 [Ascobolus immersus RN42]|uniref:DUF676 domain-containing protein n=1 Tax=Ascobolus immersus RN42 TaxID=1160509 RepID=A0A3N4HNV0_ASCIM|nr:hypothetical protein BJ508DRAFT_418743 [Ascobolus immersus RN42]